MYLRPCGRSTLKVLDLVPFLHHYFVFLFRPHRCPEPRYRSYASNNITKRLSNRQIYAPHGGVRGCKHNRRYIYSRYRTTGYIKDSEEECVYTTSAFLPDSESLCLGTRNGDVKIVNYYGQVSKSFTISVILLSEDCSGNNLGWNENNIF